jgi:hypothetical protein
MEPFESTTDLFNQAILVADLERHLNITVIADNKAKDLFKVTKANPILEYRTGDNVIIYLNEGIFDKLTEPQRLIVIDEALSYIVYDVEHDKLTIKKPDVITFSEILTKHTFETWNVLRESVKTLYAAEKQEGDQEDDEVANARTSTQKQY